MSNQHIRTRLKSVRAPNLLALLAFLGTTMPLSAQIAVDSVSDGARIRISATPLPRIRYIVPLDSMRRDTLYFSTVPAIPVSEVRWLELSLGKTPHFQSAARGASRGFLVGAFIGVGLVTAGAIEDRRNPCDDDCFITATGVAAVLTGGTLILTTSIGTIVGLMRRPERWVTVRLR